MKIFRRILSETKFWRHLTNFWTLALYAAIIYDFASNHRLHEILPILTGIYIGILAIYVSDKEFERWYEVHDARHPGEWFVVSWTVLVVGLFLAKLITQSAYDIPDEVAASYIAVLTILGITRKSKVAFLRKCGPAPSKPKNGRQRKSLRVS